MPFLFLVAGGTFVLAARVAIRFLRKHEDADIKDDLFFTDDDAAGSIGRRNGGFRTRSSSTPLRSGPSSGALESFLPQQHCLYEAAQLEPELHIPELGNLSERNLKAVVGLPQDIDGSEAVDLVSIGSSEARRRAASVLKVNNWDDAGASADWSVGSLVGSDRSAGGSSGDEAAQTPASPDFEPSFSMEPQGSQQSSLNGPARSGGSDARRVHVHDNGSAGIGSRSQSMGERRVVDLAAAAATAAAAAANGQLQTMAMGGSNRMHGDRSAGSRTDATTVPYRSCGTGTATLTSSSSPDTSQFADLPEQRSESGSDSRRRARETEKDREKAKVKDRGEESEVEEEDADKAALVEEVVASGRAEQVAAVAAAAAGTPVVVGAAAASTAAVPGLEGLPLALRSPSSPPPEPMPLPPTILPTRAPDPQSLLAIQRQVEALRLQHLQRQAQALLAAPAASRATPLLAGSADGSSTPGVDTLGSGYATTSLLGSMGGAGAGVATPYTSMAGSTSSCTSPRGAGAGLALAVAAGAPGACAALGGLGNEGLGDTSPAALGASASTSYDGSCRADIGAGIGLTVRIDACNGGGGPMAGVGPRAVVPGVMDGWLGPRVDSTQSPQRAGHVDEQMYRERQFPQQQGATAVDQQVWGLNGQASRAVMPPLLRGTAASGLSGAPSDGDGGRLVVRQDRSLSPLRAGGVEKFGEQQQGQQDAPVASRQAQLPDAAVQAARMGTLQRQPRQQAGGATAQQHRSLPQQGQQLGRQQQQGQQVFQPMVAADGQSPLGTTSAPVSGTPAHGGLQHSGTWSHPSLPGHTNVTGVDPVMQWRLLQLHQQQLQLQQLQQPVGPSPVVPQCGAAPVLMGPVGQPSSHRTALVSQPPGNGTGQEQNRAYSQHRGSLGGGASPERSRHPIAAGTSAGFGPHPCVQQPLDPVRLLPHGHGTAPGQLLLPQRQQRQRVDGLHSPPRQPVAMGAGVGVGATTPLGASAIGGFLAATGTQQQPLVEGMCAQLGHSYGSDEVQSTPRVMACATVLPPEALLSSPPSFRHHLKAGGSPEASESARRTQDWLNSSRLDEPPSPVLRPHPPPQGTLLPQPYQLLQQQQQQLQQQQVLLLQNPQRQGVPGSTPLLQSQGSARMQVSPSGRFVPQIGHQDTIASRRSGGGGSSHASSAHGSRHESSAARRRREQAFIQQKLANQAPSQLALYSARLLRQAGEKLMPAPRMPGGGAFFVPLKHELRLEISDKAGSSIVESNVEEAPAGSQQSGSTRTEPHSSFVPAAFGGFRGVH